MEAEGPTSNHDGSREPVMIVLERAGDGTWIATPEYGDEEEEDGHYYAPSSSWAHDYVPVPDDDDDEEEELVDSVTAMGWSRAHCIKMAKWALACSITDFKNDITELIENYFISGAGVEDRPAQVDRVNALYHDGLQGGGGDERAHLMLVLLRDALDLDSRDDEAALLGEKDGHDDGAGAGADDDVIFKEKAVSAAGFVDRLYMRRCIKVFFDPDIHVDDESSDTAVARHLWANFMSATGFVHRLWDVWRIVDVFFDHGLDEETRRATVVRMLRDVERLLKDRAKAVATGRFNLF